MKKSKLFLTTATLVLAVTAIFATKANKRFFTTITAKTKNTGLGSLNFEFKGADVNGLMTTAHTGVVLTLRVNGVKEGPLYSVATGKQIYLH